MDVVKQEIDAPLAPPGAPIFIRGDHGNPGGTATPIVNIQLSDPASAGDLMVVAVCAQKGATPTISDSSANTYTSTSQLAGTQRQADLYYATLTQTVAENFSIKVAFSPPADHPDIRIAEYRNLRKADLLGAAHADSAPDLTVGNGSGGSRMTTTSPIAVAATPSLVVFAICTQSYSIDPPPLDYTVRIRTSPDGNFLADRVVYDAGNYDATVTTFDETGGLVTNLAAFAGITAP